METHLGPLCLEEVTMTTVFDNERDSFLGLVAFADTDTSRTVIVIVAFRNKQNCILASASNKK